MGAPAGCPRILGLALLHMGSLAKTEEGNAPSPSSLMFVAVPVMVMTMIVVVVVITPMMVVMIMVVVMMMMGVVVVLVRVGVELFRCYRLLRHLGQLENVVDDLVLKDRRPELGEKLG